MPCFKGLAVSIHTPDGPLPEYSVQKQSRVSRITSYIPVPPPKIPDSSKSTPEQSTFAISITLLTPGQNVPYSTPKPTPDNPNPKPKTVGFKDGSSLGPYQPMTGSRNETVAAYIYFDGRQKEEVATLLRRGEETWVNSRWVGVPESEGGGLAEREFLFREVGLERWLNGLDLDGKDAAAKIERRRQKMERRRRKRESMGHQHKPGDIDMDGIKSEKGRDVLRYGNNAQSPVENLSDEESFSSESDLEDDDPIPETAGQIKVALFRVLASGEIKRGEYSPQFDAHDDDDPQGDRSGQGDDADVDHTTSFAKPKSLDPKSISTQTVTGIDPSDRPYAVFTFMYRGERQLQKMGILNPSKTENNEAPSTKRTSLQTDFANLAPLKPRSKTGFTDFRDSAGKATKTRKKSTKGSESDMESDDEEIPSILGRAEAEESVDRNTHLSPDDVKQQGELAEGVRQIKLKRQHSAEPLNAAPGNSAATSTSQSNTPASAPTPPATKQATTTPPNERSGEPEPSVKLVENDEFVGSPLKKQRASLSGTESESLRKRIGPEMSANIHEVLGLNNSSGLKNESTPNSISTDDVKVKSEMDEEEL